MTAPAAAPLRYAALAPGDPAPWFAQRASTNPRYVFDTAAGRWLVLCFFGSAADEAGRRAVDAALASPLFDDTRASFFGVSVDPADETERRVRERLPGVRFLWDFDGLVSRLYGSVPVDAAAAAAVAFRRQWLVLDPTLRVVEVVPFAADGSDAEAVLRRLAALPPPERFAGFEAPPPILVLPRVFEPELCRELIAVYEARGGEPSGFMREIDGRTVLVEDPAHKRRRDVTLDDPGLIERLQSRVRRRISPEIRKVHQFEVTRMERYLVACYSDEEAGHFRAHRDNTTSGTAHRRFAVSINLNDDFEGGEIGFPEYGPRTFKPPPGGAVVFSCSLLHRVTPVTRGRRYAFLPFLYDEAAARVREANNARLGDGLSPYSAGSAGR